MKTVHAVPSAVTALLLVGAAPSALLAGPGPKPAAPPAGAPPSAPAATPSTPAAPSAKASDQPTPADLASAKEHFAKGKKLFDGKKYKDAVGEFKESYRLSRNPLLLYNIGYTIDQLGDKSMALFYYQKYMQDSPPTDSNRATAKVRADALSKEIEASSLGIAEKEAPPPVVIDHFQHEVIDSAPPGKPIDVGCFLPPGRGWTATLLYRDPNEAEFTRVPMKARYNELIGRIPARKTVGASLQYFIEVRDKSDKVVDRSGKATSPHLVFLESGAPTHYYTDLGEESARPLSREAVTSAYAGGASVGTLAPIPEEPEATGWMDAGSSRFNKVKWGATVGAVGFLAISGTFYLMSSKAASDLESEADASRAIGGCPELPCRAFSDKQQGMEGRGRRFELYGSISLAAGGLAAAGAGVLWFLDWREARRRRHLREEREQSPAINPDEGKISALPLLDHRTIGAAAAWRF